MLEEMSGNNITPWLALTFLSLCQSQALKGKLENVETETTLI